jgi:hypothetical protein
MERMPAVRATDEVAAAWFKRPISLTPPILSDFVPKRLAPACGTSSVTVPGPRCYKQGMYKFESAEERVIYKERFQGSRFDFRGRPVFQRYDCCEFVKAMILVDDAKPCHYELRV